MESGDVKDLWARCSSWGENMVRSVPVCRFEQHVVAHSGSNRD